MPIQAGQIRVVVSEPITSPLSDMIELVPASMINVAPERQDDLLAALQGVTLVLSAQPRWIAHYAPATQEIHISFRILELFWSTAYAYTVLFDEVYAARNPLDRTPADLTHPQLVANAMELLRWALQDWIDASGTPLPISRFPQRLPRRLGSHASVADELSLLAVGFILHHELAHHRFNHVPGEQSEVLEQEQEADAAAAEWILDGVPVGSPYMTKRAAGASIGMLALTARCVHNNRHGGGGHPRHFDRLFNLLDRYLASEPNHSAWIFATVAVKLHLDNSQVSVSAEVFGSYRDCLNSYIDAIARAQRSFDSFVKFSPTTWG